MVLCGIIKTARLDLGFLKRDLISEHHLKFILMNCQRIALQKQIGLLFML